MHRYTDVDGDDFTRASCTFTGFDSTAGRHAFHFSAAKSSEILIECATLLDENTIICKDFHGVDISEEQLNRQKVYCQRVFVMHQENVKVIYKWVKCNARE